MLFWLIIRVLLFVVSNVHFAPGQAWGLRGWKRTKCRAPSQRQSSFTNSRKAQFAFIVFNASFLASFPLFCLFITVDSEQMLNNFFDNNWNRTADLWCRNWPLCQLNHNHCPALIDLVVISNLLLVVVALHFHWSSRKNWQMSIKVAQKVITQENDRFWHLYKNFP